MENTNKKRTEGASRQLPRSITTVIAALAILGAITLAQWMVSLFTGYVKIIWVVGALALIAGWAIIAKSRR